MGKWTRRRFLETVGRVGGAAAVYESMVALGMVRVPDSVYADPIQMPEGAGSGKTIVILGARAPDTHARTQGSGRTRN